MVLARAITILILATAALAPGRADAVFVNRELMEFGTRIEDRVKTAVENYLADGTSRIVVFTNIKDATQDRKIASSGNEVDLGYIPVPLDLTRIPKLHGQKELEIYGLEVEVVISTPRQDIDARKVGRLVRRLLRGMNPEVQVRVNTVEVRTKEYLELERKIASLETRNMMLQNRPEESPGGGAAAGLLSILVGAGTICIAIFFLIRSIKEAAQSFGGGGPGGTAGMGMGAPGANPPPAPGGFRMSEVAPDPMRDAVAGIEQNLVILKEMIKNQPQAFASVLGEDGRDWNAIQAYLPLFDEGDRDAIRRVVAEYGLPLPLARFDEQIENDRIHHKAPWLAEFCDRLLSAKPVARPAEPTAPQENDIVTELDGFLSSMVEDYRPIRSTDYPLVVGPTSDDRAPIEVARKAEIIEVPLEVAHSA